jgi:CreA protein
MKLLSLILLILPTSAFVTPFQTKPEGLLFVQSNHRGRHDEAVPRLNNLPKQIGKTVAGAMAVLAFSFSPLHHSSVVQPAQAMESRVVGSLSGSGLVFKDTLQIEAFDDPKVKGVKLYISNFQIPITERFQSKNFFSDPSYASVACTRTGKVSIADNIGKGPGGEEVFEESKSLLFKTLRVQRIYDEDSNTVIYVSFNTRFDKSDDANKSRFKSSLCAVSLD